MSRVTSNSRELYEPMRVAVGYAGARFRASYPGAGLTGAGAGFENEDVGFGSDIEDRGGGAGGGGAVHPPSISSYAALTSLNFSSSPPRSGWCFCARRRYAALASSREALGERPRTAYGFTCGTQPTMGGCKGRRRTRCRTCRSSACSSRRPCCSTCSASAR